MTTINSQRAKDLLTTPRAIKSNQSENMKRYPNESMKLWVALEMEENRVKNLSFYGELNPIEKLILESLASIMNGKGLATLESVSVRECEAFLRDRNSRPAFEIEGTELENKFKKLFAWLRTWSTPTEAKDYHFPSEKGPFERLKLVDKVKELKAFLASKEITLLYKNSVQPELVDVDGLTVYVTASYETEREKALFEELHVLGVEAFQEDQLNFIPET